MYFEFCVCVDFVNDFDIEGDERGWYIPVTADKKSKIDKFDRIESMAGYFERLNVFFNIKFSSFSASSCKSFIFLIRS